MKKVFVIPMILFSLTNLPAISQELISSPEVKANVILVPDSSKAKKENDKSTEEKAKSKSPAKNSATKKASDKPATKK